MKTGKGRNLNMGSKGPPSGRHGGEIARFSGDASFFPNQGLEIRDLSLAEENRQSHDHGSASGSSTDSSR